MLRNVGSNWVLIVLTVVMSYVTRPFIVHTLGREGYGTWTLVTAMTGYIDLVALVSGLSGLATAGAALAVVFGLIWVLFVYRDDPYVDVRAPLVRLMGIRA